MRRYHWFQFILGGTATLFFGIMAYALIIAFTRTSGSTGLDMSIIQKVRYDAFTKGSTSSTAQNP